MRLLGYISSVSSCVATVSVPLCINPFMPNAFSQPYQLDESNSYFRVVGCIFNCYSNFKINFCKQTVENLISCGVGDGFALFVDVQQKGR